jgi:hypothetical protein
VAGSQNRTPKWQPPLPLEKMSLARRCPQNISSVNLARRCPAPGIPIQLNSTSNVSSSSLSSKYFSCEFSSSLSRSWHTDPSQQYVKCFQLVVVPLLVYRSISTVRQMFPARRCPAPGTPIQLNSFQLVTVHVCLGMKLVYTSKNLLGYETLSF